MSKTNNFLTKTHKYLVLFLCVSQLMLTSCARNINGDIPCEALEVIYYKDVQPVEAEEQLLRNNAVIEEMCQ